MRKYEYKNCRYLIGALVSVLCSTIFAVSLQFFKGEVLDYAVGMIDQLSYPLISLAGITRQLIAIKPTCQRMEEFVKDAIPI